MGNDKRRIYIPPPGAMNPTRVPIENSAGEWDPTQGITAKTWERLEEQIIALKTIKFPGPNNTIVDVPAKEVLELVKIVRAGTKALTRELNLRYVVENLLQQGDWAPGQNFTGSSWEALYDQIRAAGHIKFPGPNNKPVYVPAEKVIELIEQVRAGASLLSRDKNLRTTVIELLKQDKATGE